MTTLSVKNLSFRYGADEVLDNINLELGENAFLAVIGPNGGGKSTLIKLILGLLPMQEGEISVFGAPPHERKHLMGYVPQDSDKIKLFPVNVIDTAMMGLYAHKKFSAKEKKEKAMAALKLLGMDDCVGRRLSELSTGQRQRVLVARAIAVEPKLLILDEPTSGIDPTGQQIILDVLKARTADMSVIFVSHDLSVIPGNATAVACVNKTLHYHKGDEISPELLSDAYGSVGASLTLVCHECCDEHEHGHSVRRHCALDQGLHKTHEDGV